MGSSIPLGSGEGKLSLQRDDCLFKVRPDTERDRAFGERRQEEIQGAAEENKRRKRRKVLGVCEYERWGRMIARGTQEKQRECVSERISEQPVLVSHPLTACHL